MAPTTASAVKVESEVTQKAKALLEAATAFREAYQKAIVPIEDEEIFLWGKDTAKFAGYHG